MQDIIENQLDRCITFTDFGEFGRRHSGKVRDTYSTADDRLIIVATDRISAFDHILPQPIPFKGQVLNQLAGYFFKATAAAVPNHILSLPDPNVCIGRQCDVFPVEFIVRSYLAGHAWRLYKQGKRTISGIRLPDDLRENSPLPRPVLTPTTKAKTGHDVDVSKADIISRGLVDAVTLARLEAMAFKLFELGAEMAQERGLILVDTKYEFGRSATGQLMVVDEVHTPDSSRYFRIDSYDERFRSGHPQRQLSKEFVREWLMAQGFRGQHGQKIPEMPDDVRVKVSLRYIELYQMMTALKFRPDAHPNPLERIRNAVERHL